MVPSIYKIEAPITGVLYVMPKPSGEWLDDDMRYYHSLGITHIVSMLTKEEVHELGLGSEKDVCQKFCIKFINLEVNDRGLPDTQKFAGLIEELRSVLITKHNIAIHCRAGIGRAGLTASCLLMAMGISAIDAINFVSVARRVEIPDTEEQRSFILDFKPKP